MKPNAVTVVLAHRNDLARGQLRGAFESIGGTQVIAERSDARSGLALARQSRPGILVLETTGPAEDVLSAAAQFHMDHPDVALFFVAEAFDQDTLLKALRSGAQEVLRWPLDRAALTAAVERIAALAARKLGGGSTRRVVTVFSTKGGTGVSTIAVNLAVGLRRETGRDVVLADFDSQSGDAAFLLGLNPSRSLADVLAAPQLDSASVQDALARHPTGIYVLPQPESLERADGVTGQHAGGVLDVLSHLFDTVVVDAPHRFDDVAIEIFDRSTTILMIAEPTLPSVRAARRAQEIFHHLIDPGASERVRLVLNRHHAQCAIQPAQFEETLGMPVFATIAHDELAVSRSSDAGKPVCDEKPTSRAARDLQALVKKLVPASENGTPEPVPVARPGMMRLFGKARAS